MSEYNNDLLQHFSSLSIAFPLRLNSDGTFDVVNNSTQENYVIQKHNDGSYDFCVYYFGDCDINDYSSSQTFKIDLFPQEEFLDTEPNLSFEEFDDLETEDSSDHVHIFGMLKPVAKIISIQKSENKSESQCRVELTFEDSDNKSLKSTLIVNGTLIAKR